MRAWLSRRFDLLLAVLGVTCLAVSFCWAWASPVQPQSNLRRLAIRSSLSQIKWRWLVTAPVFVIEIKIPQPGVARCSDPAEASTL